MDSQTRQIELQRLIDGRMPEAERVAFLECLDEEPGCWREVALAFVEEQVLRAELSSVAIPEQPEQVAVRSGRRQSGIGVIAAAAAVVVIALLVGGLGGRWLNSGPTPAGMAPHQLAIESPDATKPSEASDDYYVLLKPSVVEPQATEHSPWDFVATFLQQPVFGAQTRDAIRQHGYDVAEEPVLYVIEDDKGGHYIVPQRHISFVSHEK